MSEFLRSNPESFENEQKSDPDIAELAVNGLSRVTSEQEDDADNDNYYGEDNYDDGQYDGEYDEEDGYDDDDYYSEYEEQHYGEERADFDEEKINAPRDSFTGGNIRSLFFPQRITAWRCRYGRRGS